MPVGAHIIGGGGGGGQTIFLHMGPGLTCYTTDFDYRVLVKKNTFNRTLFVVDYYTNVTAKKEKLSKMK